MLLFVAEVTFQDGSITSSSNVFERIGVSSATRSRLPPAPTFSGQL
jgi:hypothetical protein